MIINHKRAVVPDVHQSVEIQLESGMRCVEVCISKVRGTCERIGNSRRLKTQAWLMGWLLMTGLSNPNAVALFCASYLGNPLELDICQKSQWRPARGYVSCQFCKSDIRPLVCWLGLRIEPCWIVVRDRLHVGTEGDLFRGTTSKIWGLAEEWDR